ncbi:MAG: hypothetical protein HQL06_16495 [Nitrospirae bacterium]|nr:hypothetical protein [Nitrospirota bacterium]
MDSYVAGDPYIIVTDTAGTQVCVEAGNASATGKSCQAIYNQSSTATYTAFPGGIAGVLNDFMNHHENKGDKSAFTGLKLFVTAHTTEGEIFLVPSGSRAVNITAYATDTTSPIFSSVVTTR